MNRRIYNMKSLLFLAIILFCCLEIQCSKSVNNNNNNNNDSTPISAVNSQSFSSNYSMRSSGDYLQDKLFYIETLLNINAYSSLVETGSCKTLREKFIILFNQINTLSTIDSTIRNNFLITGTEATAIVQDFQNLYANSSIVQSLVNNDLRSCGYWQLYGQSNNSEFLRYCINEMIGTYNTIVQQYWIGVIPVYPEDGANYNLYTTDYIQKVQQQINKLDTSKQTMFYLPVQFALQLLRINNRDEAARFESLINGENKAAYDNLKNINWNNFSYSTLIVPGDSPNSPGDNVQLSESAKNRVQYAITAFNEKLAPIIILSGANVYPYRTQYFEAIEMKKYMMQNYSIAEKNIFIDPCARHTTTNLRNASRIIFRSNIPTTKKSLIITTKAQNDIIVANSFLNKCNTELGFVPGKIGVRVSDLRLEFTPDTLSLQLNSLDPLDP